MFGKLTLSKDGKFHGFIGEEVSQTLNNEKVHIGDVVKVLEGENHNEFEDIVAIFDNRVAVMGLAMTPISQLKIEKVVKSHKELESRMSAGKYEDFTVKHFVV